MGKWSHPKNDGWTDVDYHLVDDPERNHRISRWTVNGKASGWLGGGSTTWNTRSGASSGGGIASFRLPRSVCLDEEGSLFIADSGNHRICKWTAAGVPLGWLGGGKDGWRTGNAPALGTDPRSFFNPAGVSMDDAGNLYVVDQSNHRVSRWTPTGQKE